ncbi:2Fe-2S iron-sulfur cluster-binding protein [Pseudomonas oryzihabitans]|uniref:2Fe-2S iron-sulfur cluster-binding protein n=1 Tax=Pseudomonas oryzihabitans TaxID=47885 RepID=UPI00345FD188
MSHFVSISGLPHKLEVNSEPGALLEICELNGISFPRCRQGRCGSCQVRLVSGSVSEEKAMTALSLSERKRGAILPCVVIARSDIHIEMWKYD